MARLDLAPGKQRKLLTRIAGKLQLNAEGLAQTCRVHLRTIRDWKREKYKISDLAAKRLSKRSELPIPKGRILPDFWSTRKAGRLGAIARYRLYGNPGTPEGRSKGGRKAGRLLGQWVRNHPRLGKRKDIAFAKEIKQPPLSPLLAEFVGVLIGDGGIRNALQVTISFDQNKDGEYARWLQRVVKRLFGLDIPQWIWSRRSYQLACLRGLMDTDGGPFPHRYQVNGKWYTYPKLCFSTVSESLRGSVLRLLRNLGFHPRLARSGLVFIDRMAEAKRFYRIVGSRHSRDLSLIAGLS